jgi:hypothetical protein
MTGTDNERPALITQELKRHIDLITEDNHRLYFLIGALVDAISKLPELHRKTLIRTLEGKTEHAGKYRQPLQDMAEAIRMGEDGE